MPNLEPERANASLFAPLDCKISTGVLENEADVREEAISGTEYLLSAANYDVIGWKTWLCEARAAPMVVA